MSNILIFGDSIAFGFYDDKGGWVDRIKRDFLADSVKEEFEHDPKVYNLSISGDTTKEVLNRIDTELNSRILEDPLLVVIFALGLNDSVLINGEHQTSKTDFNKNLKELIARAKKSTEFVANVGLTPVEENLTNPIPWDTSMRMNNEEILEYEKIIRVVCKEEKTHLIELFKNQNDFLKFRRLLHDGLHPNSEGHEFLYNKIKHFLLGNLLQKPVGQSTR